MVNHESKTNCSPKPNKKIELDWRHFQKPTGSTEKIELDWNPQGI